MMFFWLKVSAGDFSILSVFSELISVLIFLWKFLFAATPKLVLYIIITLFRTQVNGTDIVRFVLYF